MLSHMLSNQVALLPPPSEPALSEWNKMLEADMATQRQCANTAVLAKAVAKCAPWLTPDCLPRFA